MEGKILLLVNVGSPKKRFILERMRELGIRVVALHHEKPEWALPYVHEWITPTHGIAVEDILATIRASCDAHHLRLDGAITFWEEEIPLLARICEEFGLVGNSVDASLHTRSKFAMQELLRRHGEPAIPQVLLRSKEDLAEAIATVGFPAVMKPLYGSDSLSVVYADSAEEASRVYDFVLQTFTSPYEGFFTYEKGIIVFQRYIPGTEFSVECFCQNGKGTVAGIHEKTPMQLPFFVETGDIAPPRISEEKRGIIEREALAALQALGVSDSLAHVELKLMENNVPHIIEVASRMGGDDIFSSTRAAYGVDMVKTGCEIALGIPVSDVSKVPDQTLFARYIIPPHSGTVSAVSGSERLSKNPAVVDYLISVTPGDVLAVPPNGFDTAGWILVKGRDYHHADMLMREAMGSVVLDIQ